MLYDKLKANNRIPFHMPGHKRNIELLGNDFPYDIDITEIENFDNLHNPENVIMDIEEKIKKLYHCDNSYLLVNGTTCGILAGVYTAVKENDTVLMARNCHKSVYNAVKLAKAKIVYLQPETDEYGISKKITPQMVKSAIESNDIKLIVLTSPTYEGVISNVEEICSIAHSKGIPVLLDAAHGAHYFNKPIADITIMSLHKTLPALTQCAVAHINSDIIDPVDFRINLSIFETSSPSYVLMSSVERCIDFAADNKQLFIRHQIRLENFYKQLSSLKHLKLLKYDDPGKINIFTGYSSISATQLADTLRQNFNIEVEMVSKDYIIAMSTICDTDENLDVLKNALLNIDAKLSKKAFSKIPDIKIPEKYCESYQILSKGKLTPLDNCLNKISCEYIWAYPPGIPVLVPGECISTELIEYIKAYNDSGIELHSTYNQLQKGIYSKEEC